MLSWSPNLDYSLWITRLSVKNQTEKWKKKNTKWLLFSIVNIIRPYQLTAITCILHTSAGLPSECVSLKNRSTSNYKASEWPSLLCVEVRMPRTVYKCVQLCVCVCVSFCRGIFSVCVCVLSSLCSAVPARSEAMPPPSDIVKVAIEWPGANAQLIEIDQVGARMKWNSKVPEDTRK